ncbi:cellulose synthase complex periplasmic endoglucanase BcsZ [Pseudomonas abieticivorans]|uniref:cellulose synthase complex periplasmic endoglucanase BcsZ n=1 Tax=Pseudomonas abieticivorans TaxID=2931382 RepID=UPI0020BEAE51|nr:cellulose synthase complex periplasmic endoglucanase BcsZ [Pseudomonas sp. PIA16]
MSAGVRGIIGGLALALLPLAQAAAACPVPAWPLWQRYASQFVQADGRVLESAMAADQSTSEGQAYAMLFALVGNDQPRFDALWRWTTANLAGGDIAMHLPGWLWGRGNDGQWQIQDAHSASDADLWFAYALLEAARVWHQPGYRDDARKLLANVMLQLLVTLPGLGLMVLPGPQGFAGEDHLWRLNPSYLPLPLLRRLALDSDERLWHAVANTSVTLLQHGSLHGFAADWVGYRATSEQGGLWVIDPIKGDVGSYDAIRVYLWLGLGAATEPKATMLLRTLDGMLAPTASQGVPPETVSLSTGTTQGQGPFGFSAALIPYFQALGHPWLADLQRRRVDQALQAELANPVTGRNAPRYYNLMLSLFALGWADHHYRFRDDGTLSLSWETACPRTTQP